MRDKAGRPEGPCGFWQDDDGQSWHKKNDPTTTRNGGYLLFRRPEKGEVFCIAGVFKIAGGIQKAELSLGGL